MAAPMKEKLSKSERKLMKKSIKSRSVLLRHEGIESVSSPSKILCVSNAGLDNHVTHDEVYGLFSCHGSICDVIMLPRKPYAFVCYLNEEDAKSAYTALNGHKLAPTEDRKEEITLYISYISKAPAGIQASKKLPPGLILLEDFISDDYAAEILSSINWDTGSKDQEKELKHRKVKHYGYEFKYSINNVDPDDPLPDGIPQIYKQLLDKALETGHVKFYPDQLTINQYQPGQGIPPHVDTTSAFEDGLMSLSLGSQVNMEFRHPNGQQLSVLLPPNSLLIMTGESRYVWSHGITPRKYDIVPAVGGGLTLSKRGVRTSFTFRKLTGIKPEEINSKGDKPDIMLSNIDAVELEKEHVHQVYEEIASHFSGTRHSPWPNIVEFIQQQEPGSLMADFGCGNGKYFGINKNLFEVGSDRSFNLAEICKERKFEVFVGDVLSIPLRAGVFDVCLCIAVIHHLATEERRLKAVQELVKILRVGGKALVYVWAMEQELNKVKSKYLKDSKGQSSCICELEGQGKISNETVLNKERKMENLYEGQESRSVKLHGGSEPDTLNTSYEKFCDIHESYTLTKADLNGSCAKCKGQEMNLKGQSPGMNMDDIFRSKAVASSNDKNKHFSNDSLITNDHSSESAIVFEKFKKDDDSSVEETTKHSEDMQESSGLKDEENLDGNHQDRVSAEDAVKTKLQVHVNRTQFKQQDLLVPWHLKGSKKPKDENSSENTFHRFYHVFKKGELELLCSKVQCCKVTRSYYDQGNWAVILEKL